MVKTTIITILSIFALWSCAKQYFGITKDSATVQIDKNLSPQVLISAQTGGIESRQQSTINDKNTLADLWENRILDSSSKTPAIDFKNHSVLLLDFGKSSHGRSIYTLNTVNLKNDTCIVSLYKLNMNKQADAVQTTNISTPFMFIKTDRIKDDTPIVIEYSKQPSKIDADKLIIKSTEE